MTAGPRSAGMDHFELRMSGSGGIGEQMETHGNKREAIRVCKKLVRQGPFGTAGAVRMVSAAGKRTLIFQCHMALTKGGKLTLKTDEL